MQKPTAEWELPVWCFDEFEEFSDTDEGDKKACAAQPPRRDVDEDNNYDNDGEQQCFV